MHVMKGMSYKEVVKVNVAMEAGLDLSHNAQVRNENASWFDVIVLHCASIEHKVAHVYQALISSLFSSSFSICIHHAKFMRTQQM